MMKYDFVEKVGMFILFLFDLINGKVNFFFKIMGFIVDVLSVLLLIFLEMIDLDKVMLDVLFGGKVFKSFLDGFVCIVVIFNEY